MFHYYKIFILIGMFVVSYGAVSWRNKFDKFSITAIRTILSIVVVWAYLLLSRFVIVETDLALATSEERVREIVAGDGAKNIAALLFGWVYGVLVTLVVLTATGTYRWVRQIIVQRSANNA